MEHYDSLDSYIKVLEGRSTLPVGFRAGSIRLEFTPAEKPSADPYTMDLSAVVLDAPTELFAGRLSRNLFPGAPIRVVRQRLEDEFTQGIVVNNKIANVCAENGEADAEEVLRAFGAKSGIEPSLLMPASTGIIGWKLPVDTMCSAAGGLESELQDRTILPVARGIMTTDLFPKVRSIEVGNGRIVGIAKGAGMIEPNMGTMLAFLFTDISLPRNQLRDIHAAAVEASFNRISIDGDQSTSDMALLFSSGKAGSVAPAEFQEALQQVCGELAEDIVRNGEGTCHVIRVVVKGSPSGALAKGLGKAVINSPLVKTAVYGDDANVGRIIMAAGDFLGGVDDAIEPEKLTVSLGGSRVFSQGAFCISAAVEEAVGAHMRAARFDPETCKYPVHDRTVDIELDLGSGDNEITVLGSDLTYGYVRENADYRT